VGPAAGEPGADGPGVPDDDGAPDDGGAPVDSGPSDDAKASADRGASADGAAALVRQLRARGWTLAVAESLTGGLVTSAVVDVPGASRVLRGGVVAYATDLKRALLGVDTVLLDRWGAVHPEVAGQMARGVRDRLGADVGLATTGVAGPGPQDGHPPGEVHVAVAWPGGTRVRSLRLAGDRAAIRAAACRAVLACAVSAVAGRPR
jgi:nicotinamide-nucleotide amidase